MNLKKQITNSWKQPELSSECKNKDQMEFSSKKRKYISIPLYVTSLASVILICCCIFFIGIRINNKNMNNKITEYVVEAYNEKFGIMSYTSPQLLPEYVMKVNNSDSYLNIEEFVEFFNNLKLTCADVDYTSIDYKTYVGNSKSVKVLYNNDLYYIYFTNDDTVIILCNTMYIIYDLENADEKFSDFINS